MKRIFDLLVSLIALIVFFPLLLISLFLVWMQDFHSPFYIAKRIGKDGKPFNLIKIRSMIINADKSGVDSTSADDERITKIGNFVRRYKIDELPQLFNVINGSMSLVGPRPNVDSDVKLYTDEENKLLSVQPGITDFSSIIFSDESDILHGSFNPDLKYNQVIRPWKSRLGLFYIKKKSLYVDLFIIFTTVIAIINKPLATDLVLRILRKLHAKENLIDICKREKELVPYPPPGSNEIANDRISR
jgi:lipopolysaccharide/colanic/teichoic acid biosynthesis glycosyltransferase